MPTELRKDAQAIKAQVDLDDVRTGQLRVSHPG